MDNNTGKNNSGKRNKPMNKLDQIEAAAQRVIDRWDSPNWRETEHTGELIRSLEKTLAAIKELRESVPEGLKEAIPYGHKGGLESVIVTKAAKLLLELVGD